MKEKGFTLIELLAVIVILAIIALIATPIVLNIIEDSKKSAFKQTGNGIVDAAEYYYMKEMSDGAKPTENKVFTFNGSTTGLEGLEFDGEIPKGGTLTVDVNGKVELVAHNNQYCITKGYEENEVTIKDYDGSCEISNEENAENTLDTICTLVNDADNNGKITAGDKYHCDVDPNQEEEFYFYVLTTPTTNTSVSLIMDRNINNDGTPAISGNVNQESNPQQYNLVSWISQDDYNDDTNYGEMGNTNKGPITVMNFLCNATKSWTNVPPLNFTYNDKEFQGGEYGYASFVSVNGVATITSETEPVVKTTIGTASEPLRARMMIYYSKYNDDGTVIYKGDYANIEDTSYYNSYLSEDAVSSYWVMSSRGGTTTATQMNVHHGWFVGINVADPGGVRPVITLQL